MKDLYLPEVKNDSIFTFVGNVEMIFVGVIAVALIIFIVLMIRKKRKGDKK